MSTVKAAVERASVEQSEYWQEQFAESRIAQLEDEAKSPLRATNKHKIVR